MNGSHTPTGSHYRSIAVGWAVCAVLVTAPAAAGQAVAYPSGTTRIEAYLVRPSTDAGVSGLPERNGTVVAASPT